MQEYRFKFYLNAMHSIQIEDVMGEVHPHTWEIVVDVFKQNNGFITFTEVEKPVDELLRPFQNKHMNSIKPFDAINPTLENVTMYLQNKVETMFVENGFIMSRIEVSETPSRTFVIDIRNNDPSDDKPEHIEVLTNINIIEEEANRLLNESTLNFSTNIDVEFAETNKMTYSYKRYENRRKIRKPRNKLLISIVLIVILCVVALVLLYMKG